MKPTPLGRIGTIALTLILALATAAAANAQTVTGTLQGTVTDTNGGVLPGVTITITHVDTGTGRVIVTNAEGIYNAPFLQIGRYRVKAALAGFGAVTREGIEVRLNDTRVVDIKLDPRVTQEVTVTADAPAINVTNAEIKGSLTAEQIMDKPTLSAGSFLSLAETFTGFQENPTSGQNNPTASSGSSINFNGTGTRGATFQINGVNNDDSSENQNRQGAALSTIQEFQVLKNGYSRTCISRMAHGTRSRRSRPPLRNRSGTAASTGLPQDFQSSRSGCSRSATWTAPSPTGRTTTSATSSRPPSSRRRV